ncbi:hypothetical protein ACRALDRAFT_1061507 [Sodiomyces alcalophilus JCM 7366]|uniref:uncharacterized protein n=1 Tax=Sodiomyces alcalophilus JCM 7366 TaxID=591952 RepID=UPI0039B430BB
MHYPSDPLPQSYCIQLSSPRDGFRLSVSLGLDNRRSDVLDSSAPCQLSNMQWQRGVRLALDTVDFHHMPTSE